MALKLTTVLLSDMFIVFEWAVWCSGNAVRYLSGGIHVIKSALKHGLFLTLDFGCILHPRQLRPEYTYMITESFHVKLFHNHYS